MIMIDRMKDSNASVFIMLEVSFHDAGRPDFVSLSESTGINATARAPLARAKNIKSGILKAAK